MIFRPATRKDFGEFYGRPIPQTIHAGLAAVDDAGEIKGIGGYYIAGTVIVGFSDNKEDMSPKDIVRGARMLVDSWKRVGVDIVALSGENDTPLRHFGFEDWGDHWRLRP